MPGADRNMLTKCSSRLAMCGGRDGDREGGGMVGCPRGCLSCKPKCCGRPCHTRTGAMTGARSSWRRPPLALGRSRAQSVVENATKNDRLDLRPSVLFLPMSWGRKRLTSGHSASLSKHQLIEKRQALLCARGELPKT